jgi:hypothetical protein
MLEGARHFADRRMGLAACSKDVRVFTWAKDAMAASAGDGDPHLQPRGARHPDEESCSWFVAHAVILAANSDDWHGTSTDNFAPDVGGA